MGLGRHGPRRDDRSRAPADRLVLVAIAWCWYQYVAFAYGKVDHDRGDFVVALLLLPTVGMAHLSDERRSQAAGFALRVVQVSAIATYFLSASPRSGSAAGTGSTAPPWCAPSSGAGPRSGTGSCTSRRSCTRSSGCIVIAELSSPVIFLVNERWRRRLVGAWYLFHASVYATITIAFWPHLVMMLAFLPLEDYVARLRRRWGEWSARGPARGAPGADRLRSAEPVPP